MHPAVLLVLGGLLTAAGAAHHHRGGAPRWDRDDDVDNMSSRARHPLRHHGQDAPAAGGSSLDQLLNRLDTLGSPASTSHAGYWRHKGGEDRDNQLAQERLRKVVEEYERGDVLPDAGARGTPAATAAPPRKQALVGRSADLRRKQHFDDDDDLDDDLDSGADEDDKDEDDEDDEIDDDDEDDESEEVDKSVDAPRENVELADMLDVDYKDPPQTLSDAPPAYSSYSEQKWQDYSTRERLEQSRRHGPSQQTRHAGHMAELALQHFKRMMNPDGTCKVPKPVIVNVKQQYPDPTKSYLPHCTLLHRCSDSTGCCRTPHETCRAKTTVKVELPFYTMRVTAGPPTVEMLTFYNETECECVLTERTLRLAGNAHGGSGSSSSSSSGSSSSLGGDTSYSSRKQRQARTQLDMPPAYIQLPPHTKPGCRCPSTYSPREMQQPRGCACDCFDRQTDCLRFKRGKEYFSMEDRLCIQTSQCKLPECEFGTYMKLSGRCPKKDEKFMRYSHSHRRP